MRGASKNTTNKWLTCLNEIKKELNSNNVESLSPTFNKYNVNQLWKTFLKNHNVVYRENGYYKWNDKIPVSYKLIEYFRIYTSGFSKNKKNNQEPNLFNMPSSAIPPRPKVTKTRTPKIEFQVNNEPKSELGVIRRFLKWLW